MKKLILGLGICLILGIALYFTAQYWVRDQTIRAIESATGAKVQAQAFHVKLLAGRISLHGVVLAPKEESSLLERITAADASGQMRWRERNSGMIPMEAALDNCTITLRQGNRKRFLKDQIQSPMQPTPIILPDSERSVQTRKTGIVLTTLTAKNITVLDGHNQPALASGVDCTARRGMASWQGKLTAASLGPESLPFTHVQVGFSTEPEGTRVAEFRCNINGGILSGNGYCSGDGLAALDLHVDSLQLASAAPAWCGSAISGVVSGSFSYKGDLVHWRNGTAVGSFALKDGALKVGALSQMLWLLGETTKGDALQLDSATATLTLTPEKWTLSQVSLKKKEFFEIDGVLSGGQGGKLKTDLKLGIASQGQSQNLQWTTLQVETTPDQLWKEMLSSLLIRAPAESTQPASPKPALKEKTKAAVDAVLKILGR